MIARSMFIKVTDRHGRFYIEEHRVWEPELFLDALNRFSRDDGSIAVTTEGHYREWRWKNGKKQRA